MVSGTKGGEAGLNGRALPCCVSQAQGSVPSNTGEMGVKRRKEWREKREKEKSKAVFVTETDNGRRALAQELLEFNHGKSFRAQVNMWESTHASYLCTSPYPRETGGRCWHRKPLL